MNNLFIIILILGFLTIGVESGMFLLQWHQSQMTKWFGENDFKVHSIITNTFWIITFSLFALFQFQPHHLFYEGLFLQILGGGAIIVGLITSTWGYLILGLDRSLGINFYRKDIETVHHSLYKYIKNPEEFGLLLMLFGIALLTRSTFNLFFALEFTVLMIFHQRVENLPLKITKHKKKQLNSE